MYNLLFLGFTQFVNYALVYIFTWFVTNQFDAATAGTYFLALSICHGLYVIVKWGWGQATLRYCSLCNNNDTETSLSFLFYSLKKIAMRAIIILILVAAFSRYISDFYSKPNLEVAIWGLAFFIVAKPFNEIIIQYLRVCGFIKTFSVLQYVVGPISKICSLFLLTKIIFGVFPISVSSSISEIVVGILCLFILFYLGNKKNTKHCQYFNKLNKKEVHGYVKDIGHNLLLVYLLTKADVAISGFWLVKEEIASYQVAKQLATIVALFLMAFEPFVSPAIARMIGQNKKKKLQAGYQLSVYFLGILSFAPLCTMFFYPDFILQYFGKHYQGASLALQILIAGQFVNVLTGQAGYILSMGGHSKYVLKNTLITAFCSVLLITILTPMFGLNGASASVSITIVLVNLIRLWEIKKIENITWLNKYQAVRLFFWFILATIIFLSIKIFTMSLISILIGGVVYYSTFVIIHLCLNKKYINNFISLMFTK